MSIIHEALKKVQASLQAGKPAEPAVPAVPAADVSAPVPPPRTAPAAAKPWDIPAQPAVTEVQAPQTAPQPASPALMAVLVAACLATVSYFGYPHIKGMFTKVRIPAITKPAPAQPLAKMVVTAPAAATADASVPALTPVTLNVQGVMDNGGKTVALINNKIYEEGDEINGVKILSISVDAITVLRDGQEEILRVRH